MDETIGFIGLGKLGLPMATNLVDAGYKVRVYNRTEGKAGALVARGAQECRRAADVAEQGGVVVSVVWDGSALEEVASSEGFLERLGQGGLHISMSTVSPEISRKVGDLHSRHGSVLVEAPVFGRPEAAVARGLSI
jgi:3-hydroxyisobutyrate dehydrogenase-like beta-hydroxyacid dehydrogenase